MTAYLSHHKTISHLLAKHLHQAALLELKFKVRVVTGRALKWVVVIQGHKLRKGVCVGRGESSLQTER